MSIVLTKVVQTSYACPSQWDAWDAEGRYYYLRYRSGIGTVDTYPAPDTGSWTAPPDGAIARFEHGDNLDGLISLTDFLALAGLSLAPACESAAGRYFRPDDLIFVQDESMSCELPPQTRRFLVARWPDGLTKVREVSLPSEQAMDATRNEAGHDD